MRSARKTILKIFLDTVMLLLLAMMYQKRVICIRFHEIGGLILFGLFLLHNGLNWKWFKGVSSKIFQRGLPLRSRVNWLVNVLLFISMTATIGTGLLISKTLPTSIQQAYLVKPWHYFFAAAALILIGITWDCIGSIFITFCCLGSPCRSGQERYSGAHFWCWSSLLEPILLPSAISQHGSAVLSR